MSLITKSTVPTLNARLGEVHLLIVDDDPGTLASLSRAFRLAGYEATVCESATRALDLLRNDRFDLLLSDVVMPGMTGPELAAALRERHPTLPVLFMSGFPGVPNPAPNPLPPGATLLDKPFSIDRLLHAVAAAVGSPTHHG